MTINQIVIIISLCIFTKKCALHSYKKWWENHPDFVNMCDTCSYKYFGMNKIKIITPRLAVLC